VKSFFNSYNVKCKIKLVLPTIHAFQLPEVKESMTSPA